MNYIFLLFWVSLLVSQSAMDVMSVVVILFSIRLLFQSQEKSKFFLTDLEKIWPLWLAVFFMGLALNIPVSSWQLAQMFEMKWIIVLYGIVIFYSVQKPWAQLQQLKIFSGFLIFCSLYALLTRWLNFDLVSQEPIRDVGRSGGFFNDPMTFAHVYGMFFSFLLSWLLLELSRKNFSWSHLKNFIQQHLILVAACLICGIAVLFSFTRGVWLAVGISCLVAAFMVNKRWGWSCTGIAVVSFAGLFLFWPSFHERILFVFNFSDNYDGERIWLWRANWRMFLDHPFFGGGYGRYHEWLPTYFDIVQAPETQRFISHSHNQYFHFLSNTGFLGTLCYLIFLFVILIKTIKGFKKFRSSSVANWLLGSVAVQISFILGGLTECNFERAKMRITYLALVGIPLAFLLNSPQSSDESRQVNL